MCIWKPVSPAGPIWPPCKPLLISHIPPLSLNHRPPAWMHSCGRPPGHILKPHPKKSPGSCFARCRLFVAVTIVIIAFGTVFINRFGSPRQLYTDEMRTADKTGAAATEVAGKSGGDQPKPATKVLFYDNKVSRESSEAEEHAPEEAASIGSGVTPERKTENAPEPRPQEAAKQKAPSPPMKKMPEQPDMSRDKMQNYWLQNLRTKRKPASTAALKAVLKAILKPGNPAEDSAAAS